MGPKIKISFECEYLTARTLIDAFGILEEDPAAETDFEEWVEAILYLAGVATEKMEPDMPQEAIHLAKLRKGLLQVLERLPDST